MVNPALNKCFLSLNDGTNQPPGWDLPFSPHCFSWHSVNISSFIFKMAQIFNNRIFENSIVTTMDVVRKQFSLEFMVVSKLNLWNQKDYYGFKKENDEYHKIS